MTAGLKPKEAFDVESEHGVFYTGGHIEWHEDGLYCNTTTCVSVFDTNAGLVTSKFAEEGDDTPDTIITFTKSNEYLVTAHRSGLLKLWNLEGQLEKTWKSIHKGPIAKLSQRGKVLATAGSDGEVRLWDMQSHTCVLALKGCPGVVNVAEFHPTKDCLVASGDDGKILLFELKKGNVERIFSGHLSKVTSICFDHDNQYFVSSGRDKAIILWDINEEVALKTIPISETIESVICLPKKFILPNGTKHSDGVFVATGGSSGLIRVWDVKKCKEIYVQQDSLVNKSADDGLAITEVLFDVKSNNFAVITAEHNVIIHDLNTFSCIRQFVGFSDEIHDIIFLGENDAYLAVATNSIDIKLYETSTMSCQFLKGHTDLVLALGKSPTNVNLMVSSSKDNSVRIWVLNDKIAICIGVGTRHTASVGAVTISSKFIVSGSQDTCVKTWEIPEIGDKTILNCLDTVVAHQKDINCISVSPNDKIIATSSQDKTAKLWTENLDLIGSLKGHKKGVWCVKFSPVDQVVLTSCADGSIKLWSISELSCLKSFQGHEISVLQLNFLTNGMQFLSTDSEGLVKLFNVKTSETVSTFDKHEGRVWALAVKKDETGFVTGGSDSTLLKWKDVTEERQLAKLQEQEELVMQEQQLQNYLQSEQLMKALKLALRLDRPFQVLKILQNIIKKGEVGLSDTVQELQDYQKEQLFKVALNWNTNSRYFQPAQMVLNVLIIELQSGKFRPAGLASMLEGALPYMDRHFKRITQVQQDSHILKYTLDCMQMHAKRSV